MSEEILSVQQLRKEFGDTVAVDKLSFSLNPGEVVGLLGPNGAGKTTAIQMLLGLIKPTSGRIKIFGQNFEENRIALLKKSNFASAYANLPNNIKVEQNLTVFSMIYGVSNFKSKINEVLDLFEIGHLKKRVTGHLSSGETTRLNLAKAMLNDPELLYLDEPTASLDPDIADKVRSVINRVRMERKISVLYTSHNMHDIESVCDRVIFLHLGKKIAEGSSSEINQRFDQKSLEDTFIHIARSGELIETDDSDLI
ncbi:MAG: putative multidrug ABC transporter ATP-binding protein YbhF [Candidatus Moanabacter tarae]|uniref:Putative multidrug ABC transporter ATP-binding protein YbhF n=1 Tax=Candidatus Moanibacter tarae TaxID=2200854 RepID=A0A2Z4AF81_9BACT|nr:MAG: putative multidrug ABC transporter ATP-binding protein YbhF [Candidatus Moanabacter tarae]|tara:strand:- start:35829 stop:36590 length:762 start_codon:yes stop_codon:yes gene_type:complete